MQIRVKGPTAKVRQEEDRFSALQFTSRPACWLYHGLRLVLAGIFFWSGVTKAVHPMQFADIIGAYGLLPEALLLPAALSLIAAEILAAAALLFEKRGGLTLIALMTLLFVGVLSYGLLLGLDIDCGCFGPGDPEAEAFHDLRGALLRDLLLLAAIGYLYLWRFRNRLVPKPWFGNRHDGRAISKEV
ncbi:MAG TPA: MauE/DoxX family redox-associated membrane protein [Desulfuromonadales bacterium]|nr:MauE/DoxX family redox-associated membrane protein [Desulfuromonadales bacterium]